MAPSLTEKEFSQHLNTSFRVKLGTAGDGPAQYIGVFSGVRAVRWAGQGRSHPGLAIQPIFRII